MNLRDRLDVFTRAHEALLLQGFVYIKFALVLFGLAHVLGDERRGVAIVLRGTCAKNREFRLLFLGTGRAGVTKDFGRRVGRLGSPISENIRHSRKLRIGRHMRIAIHLDRLVNDGKLFRHRRRGRGRNLFHQGRDNGRSRRSLWLGFGGRRTRLGHGGLPPIRNLTQDIGQLRVLIFRLRQLVTGLTDNLVPTKSVVAHSVLFPCVVDKIDDSY